jgi:hypothetical protein
MKEVTPEEYEQLQIEKSHKDLIERLEQEANNQELILR